MSDRIPIMKIIARREVKLVFDFVIPEEAWDPNTDYNKIATAYTRAVTAPLNGKKWDTALFPIHVDCIAEEITD